MGMFDTFLSRDEQVAVQLKIGKCLMDDYVEGASVDSADFPDGIYFGHEGVVVIAGGLVESVTERDPDPARNLPRFTKWGGAFDPKTQSLNDLNPISIAVAEVNLERLGFTGKTPETDPKK